MLEVFIDLNEVSYTDCDTRVPGVSVYGVGYSSMTAVHQQMLLSQGIQGAGAEWVGWWVGVGNNNCCHDNWHHLNLCWACLLENWQTSYLLVMCFCSIP